MMEITAPKTLENFSIAAEEVAADYFEGDAAYAQHLELLEYAQRGMTAADYAKSPGITRASHPKEYKTRYEYMRRFLQGRHHAAIQALTTLRILGVLETDEGDEGRYFDPRLLKPFSSANRRFELLAMLSAFGFWTGSASSQACRSHPNRTAKDFVLLHRDVADKEAVPIVDEFIEKLKNQGLCTPYIEQTSKRGGRIVAPVTRVMTLMNGMLGKKSKTDQAFPEIFELADQSLGAAASREEREKSWRILRDFMLAFFVIRVAYRPEHGWCGWIVAHEDESPSEQRRVLFEKMLSESGFDGLSRRLHGEKNRHGKEQKYSYITRVTFPYLGEETVRDIREEFRRRIDDVLL